MKPVAPAMARVGFGLFVWGSVMVIRFYVKTTDEVGEVFCAEGRRLSSTVLLTLIYKAKITIRTTSYALRITLYELRSTNYALRTTLNELRSTSYAQRTTLYELRSTNHIPQPS